MSKTHLKLGDRVVWNAGKAEFGTVRWLGALEGLDGKHVGINCDNPVGSGSGHYNDLCLMVTKPNHATFIPAYKVMKKCDYDVDPEAINSLPNLKSTSSTAVNKKRRCQDWKSGHNQSDPQLIDVVKEGKLLEVVKLLSQDVFVDSVCELGRSALMYACQLDHFQIVKVLVGWEANVNFKDRYGQTPLMVACHYSKNPLLMAYLVDYGADTNSISKFGNILHAAISNGNDVGLTFSLSFVNIDDTNPAGMTSLHMAALYPNVEILKILLLNGADPFKKDYHGRTALYRAVYSRSVGAIELLLEKNLSAADADHYGRTPIDVARSLEFREGHAILIKAYSKSLPTCYCDKALAHVKFHPCGHQTTCAGCCQKWKKCFCGEKIKRREDVLANIDGDSYIELEVNDKECPICYERLKDMVFNCGHTCCETCGTVLDTCHICRVNVTTRLKMFL